MEPVTHLDKTFDNVNYAAQTLRNREFENCIFKNCDFSNADIDGNGFVNCTFDCCNLTMMKIAGTRLNNIRFIGCKLTGVEFGASSNFLFSITCISSQMSYCSFQNKKMEKTLFKDCNLSDGIFIECNLRSATFSGCELTNTLFEHNALEKADFRCSRGFIIDPENNKLHHAKFTAMQLANLLVKYDLDIE